LDPIKNDPLLIKHFNAIIKNIHALIRQYPKGTVNYMLYTERGNGIYSNIVNGISNKKEFVYLTAQRSRVKA